MWGQGMLKFWDVINGNYATFWGCEKDDVADGISKV